MPPDRDAMSMLRPRRTALDIKDQIVRVTPDIRFPSARAKGLPARQRAVEATYGFLDRAAGSVRHRGVESMLKGVRNTVARLL